VGVALTPRTSRDNVAVLAQIAVLWQKNGVLEKLQCWFNGQTDGECGWKAVRLNSSAIFLIIQGLR
jgi:hypothetical protein